RQRAGVGNSIVVVAGHGAVADRQRAAVCEAATPQAVVTGQGAAVDRRATRVVVDAAALNAVAVRKPTFAAYCGEDAAVSGNVAVADRHALVVVNAAAREAEVALIRIVDERKVSGQGAVAERQTPIVIDAAAVGVSFLRRVISDGNAVSGQGAIAH